MSRSRRQLAVLGAAAMLIAAGCASGTSHTTTGARAATSLGGGQATSGPPEPPTPTTQADWKPITDVLGRTGKMMGGTVYGIPLPRNDLTVTSQGVTIKPGLALGGYAAFAKYSHTSMLMGDLVVTEAELPKATDALQAAGIEQTALHKHLLQQSPAIWWTHIHATGDPVRLAQGLQTALAVTSIPPTSPPPSTQPPLDLDTAGIDKALSRKGTVDGGIYKFSIARKDMTNDGQYILPPDLGLTTIINFQPLGGKKAAINGDFVMTVPEKVIQALRKGGISVVELHNHSRDEQPRLFYLHFWAAADGVTLAKALRPALDATNLALSTP